MTKKIIVITTRWPRNRSEKSCYANTYVDGQVADIFVNKSLNKTPGEHIDTLYHEFTHALVRLYRTPLEKQKDTRKEERLCKKIGAAAAEAFKKCMSA